MRKIAMFYWMGLVVLLLPPAVFAQAFGEYGRAVGSIPHGQGVMGGRPSGGVTQGGVSGGTVVESDVRRLPARLVVAVNDAGLFPSQDDQSEKLGQLNQGEVLTPMIQSTGGNDWFMVKTQKGIIGWIKSSDVRAEKIKK
jgi:hypothetical protein